MAAERTAVLGMGNPVVSTISEEMTPAVAAAVEPLAREIHALISARQGKTGVLPHEELGQIAHRSSHG